MVALAVLAAPLAAQAQIQDLFDRGWYLTPQYGYAWPDSKERTANGPAWQLEFGDSFAHRWDLEFNVLDYKLRFDDGDPGSYRQTAYGLNVLWILTSRSYVFTPFLLLGAGINHQIINLSGCACTLEAFGSTTPAQPNTGTKLYGALGIGLLISPWHWNGALRISLQYIHTGGNSLYGNHGYNDRIGSIGLQIPLGPSSTPASM